MKLGINGTGLVQRASVAVVEANAKQAEQDGFHSYWLAEHPTGGFDALTVLSLVGQSVQAMELGTAIIPTFPRHPMTLAGQALTVASACKSPLTLGIGLSHASMMADLGIAFEKPIGHLRDYLSVLMPLVNTGAVDFEGDFYSSHGRFFKAPERPPSVLVAALGPQALKVAGHRCDGTTLAWVGPKTIAGHIKPRLFEGAAKAGRGEPRILATLPICVTDNERMIRDLISKNLAFYATLPSYKAMFVREGISAPGDLALVGSAAKVEAALEALAAAGVSDYAASAFTTNEVEASATAELLRRKLKDWGPRGQH